MFGLNERVGRAYFNSAKPDELLVTSRFFTLQGEGPYRGQPAYFIRLAKCNLACFFCDTYFDSGEWRSFDSLLEEADKVIAEFFNGCNMAPPAWAQGLKKEMVLVVTGGEPTLQNNLAAFLKRAENYFKYTQIESNGTGLIAQIPSSTTLVISPKCQEKTNAVGDYLEPSKDTLQRADCLKFVMCAPKEEYSPYCEVPLGLMNGPGIHKSRFL
jgi:7-carboxy-7-deazaguanine synthase